jgi:hypothetical protein
MPRKTRKTTGPKKILDAVHAIEGGMEERLFDDVGLDISYDPVAATGKRFTVKFKVVDLGTEVGWGTAHGSTLALALDRAVAQLKRQVEDEYDEGLETGAVLLPW